MPKSLGIERLTLTESRVEVFILATDDIMSLWNPNISCFKVSVQVRALQRKAVGHARNISMHGANPLAARGHHGSAYRSALSIDMSTSP